MAAKSIVRDIDHMGRIQRKQQRLTGLQAIKEEWIAAGYNETDLYVNDLSQRIRRTEVQLKNMRP
jgi:hypothetical protein